MIGETAPQESFKGVKLWIPAGIFIFRKPIRQN